MPRSCQRPCSTGNSLLQMYQRNEAAAARSCIHACELVYGSPSDGAVWARELEPPITPPFPIRIPTRRSLLLNVLLLYPWPGTIRARWCADTKRVLTVRKPYTAAFDETIERIAVKLIDSLGCRVDILELDNCYVSNKDLIRKRTKCHLPPRSTSDQCSSV